MPFGDNLPADGTTPWGNPLRTAWENLKVFVNGLESALGGKADATALAGKADTGHTHTTGDVTGLDTTLAAKVPSTRMVAGKPLSADVTLVKGDVGLGSVDNTSDAAKPVSSATQAALDAKVPTSRTVAGKPLSSNVALVKADVGLANVDNTSDAAKPVSTATQTALNAKVGSSDGGWSDMRKAATVAALPDPTTVGPTVLYIVLAP